MLRNVLRMYYIVIIMLKPFDMQVSPFQFGNRNIVNINDALLYMLHAIYRHLDIPGSSVRIMFFDL